MSKIIYVPRPTDCPYRNKYMNCTAVRDPFRCDPRTDRFPEDCPLTDYKKEGGDNE